jgi:predicted transposase YdaD
VYDTYEKLGLQLEQVLQVVGLHVEQVLEVTEHDPVEALDP